MSANNTNKNPKNVIGLPGLNREINASQVMDLIFKQGTISRAQLVKLTGIKANTISSIVDQFIKNGLIKQVGLAKSTGGRPPVLYEVRSSGLHVVGIEVRSNEMIGVLVNLHGTLMATQTKKFTDTSPDTVVLTIKTIVNELCEKAEIPRYKLDGVGIAFPGIVDSHEQNIIYSVPLKWEDVPLGKMLSDVLNIDVKIVNNAVANLINACFQKRKENPESMLLYYISLNETNSSCIGFGCAIALNGRAYLGRGHMVGETSVSFKHPLQRAISRAQSEPFKNLNQLVKASLEDKKMAQQIWAPLARSLGTEIARGVDIINPSEIVISSDLHEFEQFVGDSIHKTIANDSAPGVFREHMKNKKSLFMPKITFQKQSETTIAAGSALPYIQKFSNPPIIRGAKLL